MAITYHAGRRIQGTSADKAVPSGASRGTVTTDGLYTVITFTEDGTFTPTSSFSVEHLIVAGGGGGGMNAGNNAGGGGGGAGEMLENASTNVTAGNYSVVVGTGGVGGNFSTKSGTKGTDSSWNGLTAEGGGRGAGAYSTDNINKNGGDGGSGGGASTYEGGTGGTGGSSGTGGNDGGNASSNDSSYLRAGNGGGAGSAGTDSTISSGGGGNGKSNSITGSAVNYASGGTGGWFFGMNTSPSNSGAYGNGGNGRNGNAGLVGSASTGGNGVVILRFLTSGNTYETGTPTAILGSTNVQVGSRYEETDTRKMYHYESGLKYEDDFSTDNWTDNDSTYIGVSGGSMNWNCKRDGSNDASVYDLTSTSANWVLRFKLTVTNVSSSTQAGNGFYVGLSDSIQTAGQSTSQDFIGVAIYNDNTDTYRTIDADGSALPAIYSGDSSQTTTYNTGSVWYYEIIKTGSSYTVEAFSGSDYSTGSEGKITGSSDATGLRYLKVLNDMASIPTSTNPFQGTINDLKFYNGVTSSTGNAWKEEGT